MLTTCGGKALPPESAAIGNVIRGAQTAELNTNTPPASYHQDGKPDQVLQPMLDRVEVQLSPYYTGALLAQKVHSAQDGVRGVLSQKGGGGVGGVRSLELQEVQISGDTARAKARVTVWFKTAQFWWQDPEAQPTESNIVDLELRLTRIDGGWKIQDESWRFAPGGGP